MVMVSFLAIIKMKGLLHTGGSTKGFRSEFFHLPGQNKTVIILSNMEGGANKSPSDQVLKMVNSFDKNLLTAPSTPGPHDHSLAGVYIKVPTMEKLQIQLTLAQQLSFDGKTGFICFENGNYATATGLTQLKFNKQEMHIQQKGYVNSIYKKLEKKPITGNIKDYEGLYSSDEISMKFAIKIKRGKVMVRPRRISKNPILNFVARFFPLKATLIQDNVINIEKGNITLVFHREKNKIISAGLHGQNLVNVHYSKK